MSEEISDKPNNAFQIHQGSYLNARLNNLLERVDILSLSPLAKDQDSGILNVRLLLRNLSSIGISIYGEILGEEKETLKLMIEHFEEVDYKKIFVEESNYNNSSKNSSCTDSHYWENLNSDILEFRLYISELLEKYGLGLSFEKNNKQEMLE